MSPFVPTCRCGGMWTTLERGSIEVVLCSSCQALAHPSIAAQVSQSQASRSRHS